MAIFSTTNSRIRTTPNRIQAGSQSWRLQVRRPSISPSSLFEFRPDLRAGDCRFPTGPVELRCRPCFACALRPEFPADSVFAGAEVDNTKFTPGTGTISWQQPTRSSLTAARGDQRLFSKLPTSWRRLEWLRLYSLYLLASYASRNPPICSIA